MFFRYFTQKFCQSSKTNYNSSFCSLKLYLDKFSIKSAIEDLFNVKVLKINTCNIPKKKKRIGKYIGWKPQYKKAIVTFEKIINENKKSKTVFLRPYKTKLSKLI